MKQVLTELSNVFLY